MLTMLTRTPYKKIGVKLNKKKHFKKKTSRCYFWATKRFKLLVRSTMFSVLRKCMHSFCGIHHAPPPENLWHDTFDPCESDS